MSDSQPQALPVFPLGTVVFPEGHLPLRIFEPRYVDMISRCTRENIGFVVVAIKEGREAGDPATPYEIGTEVRISDWDQDDNGLLLIDCIGVAKLALLDSWLQDDGLRLAQVQRFPPEPTMPVPAEHGFLWELLSRYGVQEQGASQRNAAWLGARLVERLPLPLALKQELLSLSDPLERLEEIQRQLHGSMQA